MCSDHLGQAVDIEPLMSVTGGDECAAIQTHVDRDQPLLHPGLRNATPMGRALTSRCMYLEKRKRKLGCCHTRTWFESFDYHNTFWKHPQIRKVISNVSLYHTFVCIVCSRHSMCLYLFMITYREDN